jgi:hypothetical protein
VTFSSGFNDDEDQLEDPDAGCSISKVEATQTQGVMACNSIAMVVLLMLLQAKSPSQ